MKVTVKKLKVEMELKNNGIEFEVRDTKENFLGDMIIAKAGLTWCQGKKKKENGVTKSWEEIIEFFSE